MGLISVVRPSSLLSFLPTHYLLGWQFCPLPNVHSRNALKSFYDTFVRKYKQQLEGFSEDDFRALEGHLDEKAFVDNIMNAVENDEPEAKNRKRFVLYTLSFGITDD